ncbi:MAG TPA: hypothetical protein VK660_10955 [Xanthomonadaceae bacterium]|nr:hypothetical protein [Xanthomonadaceae bacterium]
MIVTDRTCLALLFGALLSPAMAADSGVVAPDIEAHCETYDAKYEAAPMLRVHPAAGDARVYLQKAVKACPATGACPQRQKAFLVEGDQVLASKAKDGFRCVYYGTAGGKLIAGFLPDSALTPAQEATQLTPDFLAGTWYSGTDTVQIASRGQGKVHASGTATWQGMGTMHDGSFEADASVSGMQVAFKDDTCEVQVRRRGNYLLLDDNSQCGGMNVRFEGIYVRGK